jgi:hypothetical protein
MFTRALSGRGTPLLLSAALVIVMQGAFAQMPPGAQPPAAQGAVQPPLATLAGTPGGALGLCQCIADFNRLVFSCPGSAEACESSCGRKYSFVPYQRCPMPAPH